MILVRKALGSAISFLASFHVGSPGAPRSISTASKHVLTNAGGLFKALSSVISPFENFLKITSKCSAFAATAASTELTSAVAAGAASYLKVGER